MIVLIIRVSQSCPNPQFQLIADPFDAVGAVPYVPHEKGLRMGFALKLAVGVPFNKAVHLPI